MVTIAVSLRYHVKTDTYYIQIKGTQYTRLNTKIRRITTYLEHIQGEGHAEERIRLEEHRRCLLQEKQQAQYYVVIPASDIPESVRARPIYALPGQIVTADPERYTELLAKLQGQKE